MLPRRFLLGAALLAMVSAAFPTAQATSTVTTCIGGGADGAVFRIPIPGLLGAPSETLYLSRTDGSLWRETNAIPGLERSARVCYEQTINGDGVIVSVRSYVEYEADELIVP